MKYYSEVLNRIFDSEGECLEAERKHYQRARRKANLIAEKKAEIKRLNAVAEKAYSDYLSTVRVIGSLEREIESL